MKKIFLMAFLALFTVILVSGAVKRVYAATNCEEFSVDPAAGAPAGTTFTIRARNCTGVDPTRYTARVYDTTGINMIGEYTLQSVGSGLYIAIVNNVTTVGSYAVTLHNKASDQNELVAVLTVLPEEEEQPPTFECQTIGGIAYCMRCVVGGTHPGCYTAQGADVMQCPATCQRQYNYKPELCNTDQGVQTAIGCIPFRTAGDLAGFFIVWGIGIGGGIAMLLIIYAGILITTSAGDPKRLQSGKELMTSALVGVLLLIFAIFVMRILGVQVLGLF